jgi:hypothetical protein
MFMDLGYRVTLDGQVERRSDINPFLELRASMSGATWRRVSRVLAEVLEGPDGDERLHRLLERTIRADHEQRRQRAS